MSHPDNAFYASVIIDISQEKLDRVFQYRIPEDLFDVIRPGIRVLVPFGKGNRQISAWVIEVTDRPEFDVEKIKDLLAVAPGSIPIETKLIALAAWMRRNYGGTMNQALKAVLPVKNKTREKEKRVVELAVGKEQAEEKLTFYQKKHQTARARLLEELIRYGKLPYEEVTGRLHITAAVMRVMEEQGVIKLLRDTEYRNPIGHLTAHHTVVALNDEQKYVTEQIRTDMERGEHPVYLLHGVTGSGKTEVYMELIASVLAAGRQAIVLIPEIALTYQTVMRFYSRFGDQVSILNSRLSAGERYDQYQRAKNGEISIMIGPRSALFTPFPSLGLIVIDEEHESSYKSETLPRYHAREVAIRRAAMEQASVILASATPSTDSYYHAKKGDYKLLTMKNRVKGRKLPTCHVVDLREELKAGNRSVLSRKLQELMEERLEKKQQVMLFLNRRGMSGFISCRACGTVIRCPHCDVSLSLHGRNRLVCHYCGYEEVAPDVCPSCGSRYISGFKAGTQRMEELVQKRFPQAKILRMDQDTTRRKDSYEKILSSFANREADILIGTQMIVKGHDFPGVTLVGVLAADLSLYVGDYRATERTFQLLTQAAGRAGRGEEPGEVVIQTYSPAHYVVKTAAAQDYEAFYETEIAQRTLASYPPVSHMLLILITAKDENLAQRSAERIGRVLRKAQVPGLSTVGPAQAAIAKINDIYRRVIYLKHARRESLVEVRERLEHFLREQDGFDQVSVTFDTDPVNGA